MFAVIYDELGDVYGTIVDSPRELSLKGEREGVRVLARGLTKEWASKIVNALNEGGAAANPPFNSGDRVEIAPHFDLWMRGDRYGDVVKHSAKFGVYVKMDKSGRTLRFAPEDLTLIARKNPRERTKNFTRTRVRSPRRFAKGSLRTKVLSGGTELILGHLKGETRRTGRGRRVQVVQAVLVPRKKAKRNPIVAVLNPPIPRGAVEIGRMHLIKYHHTGKDRGYYKHTFKGTERLIGMPDGSLRIIP